MKLRYQVKWSTNKYAEGDLCIVDNIEKTTFQYWGPHQLDQLLSKVDRLNEEDRVVCFPKLRLVKRWQ